MRRSKYKWSLREPRQNRHMQYLLIFPSFPEETKVVSGHGKCEDVALTYKVSEMHVQPYQCHAVDSVNPTCWNTTFFISASILLFIGLFCFRATHRHISLLSFICSTYTVGIFTQRSHIYYIWTMSCTSFQSIQHQTRCWIVTDL